MRFLVTRTSEWDDANPPCPGARREAYVRRDERAASAPEKIPVYSKDASGWYGQGRNHRVEHNRIVRDLDDEDWFIDIDSLDDLMAFSERHGELVLGFRFSIYGVPGIEIYDSRRE